MLCQTCERLVYAAISGSLPRSTWHDHQSTIDSLVEAIHAGCAVCLIFLGEGLYNARKFAERDPASPTVFWLCENQEYSDSLTASSLLFDVSLRHERGHFAVGRRFLITLKQGKFEELPIYNIPCLLVSDC